MSDREIIRVYVTSEMKNRIRKAAKQRDVSASQWMKEAAQTRLASGGPVIPLRPQQPQQQMPESAVKMLEKDNTSSGDRERMAFFFIMGSVDKFTRLQDKIYDFKAHSIRPEVLNEVDFSSGERRMILLAFNLYNNWECPSPNELLASLDKDNQELALKAMRVRFAMG